MLRFAPECAALGCEHDIERWHVVRAACIAGAVALISTDALAASVHCRVPLAAHPRTGHGDRFVPKQVFI